MCSLGGDTLGTNRLFRDLAKLTVASNSLFLNNNQRQVGIQLNEAGGRISLFAYLISRTKCRNGFNTDNKASKRGC